MINNQQQPISFLSFDVEALPGRATEQHVDRLVWGRFGGQEYGLRRICAVLHEHNVRANFLIDMSMCVLYGDKIVAEIGHYLLGQGHEIHVHLHSEWLIRKWDIKGDFKKLPALNYLGSQLNQTFLSFSFFKFKELFGEEPTLFRCGGYLFNEHTINAAKQAGFKALSNFNSERHASEWIIHGGAINNEMFSWDNGVIELPVDLSPEPLTLNWEVYQGTFDRIRSRKNIKTFNLTLHSWSLLHREGQFFTDFEPKHELRLHEICQHLKENTEVKTYKEFIAATWDVSKVETYQCTSDVIDLGELIYVCNICSATLEVQPTTDICPGCGSRARHRQLKDAIKNTGNPFTGNFVLANYANSVEKAAFLFDALHVLNFDVRPVREVDIQMDIQNMHLVESDTYDSFLALHVLNHVKDDQKALQEIKRILRPGGVAVVTIPYRNHEPTSNCADITEHYGAAALEEFGVGTYRRYGFQDAITLFSTFFEVTVVAGYDALTQASMNTFFLHKEDFRP